MVAGVAAILIIALIGALPGGPSGRATQASATALTPRFHDVSRDSAPRTGTVGVWKEPVCKAATAASGYVNPLARARVKSERIDQGVDYAGSGALVAVGAATVTYIGTHDTGWPGAFIEYRLLSGPDAGCYVYYAEGVIPRPGLHVGQTLAAGQPVAKIIKGWSTGIELGWGAGVTTKTAAGKRREWTALDDDENVPTDMGKSFSSLIVSLGGQAGKVEGKAGG